MAKHIIAVSRSGFTMCPGCSAHIKVAADVGSTTCPFCDASILDSRMSRRGLLASALGSSAAVALVLGVAVAGCKTTSPGNKGGSDTGGGGGTPDVVIEPAPDPGPQPEYGVPMPPDPAPRPLYGHAPAPQPLPKPVPTP